MSKIINATGTKLKFFNESDVKYTINDMEGAPDYNIKSKRFIHSGSKPILVIPPSDIILKAVISFKKHDKDIPPVLELFIEEIDPIPEEADIVIVSEEYARIALASNIRGTEKLYVPKGRVYKEDDEFLGFVYLERFVKDKIKKK